MATFAMYGTVLDGGTTGKSASTMARSPYHSSCPSYRTILFTLMSTWNETWSSL